MIDNEKLKTFLKFITEKTKDGSIVWNDDDNKSFYIIENCDFINQSYILSGFLDADSKYNLHLDCHMFIEDPSLNNLMSSMCDMTFDYTFDQYNYSKKEDKDEIRQLFKDLENAVIMNCDKNVEQKENALIDFVMNGTWSREEGIIEEGARAE